MKWLEMVSGVLRAAWGTAGASVSFLLRRPLRAKRSWLGLNPPGPSGAAHGVFSSALQYPWLKVLCAHAVIHFTLTVNER